jgi:hypothetical protein
MASLKGGLGATRSPRPSVRMFRSALDYPASVVEVSPVGGVVVVDVSSVGGVVVVDVSSVGGVSGGGVVEESGVVICCGSVTDGLVCGGTPRFDPEEPAPDELGGAAVRTP